MNDRIYLDSNIVIAYLNSSHEFHARAVRIISKNKHKYAVSILVVDEVIYILNKLYSDKGFIYEVVRKLLSSSEVEVIGAENTKADLIRYIELWKNCPLKPRDAQHYFVMKSNKVKRIATFDDDFIKNQKVLKVEIVK